MGLTDTRLLAVVLALLLSCDRRSTEGTIDFSRTVGEGRSATDGDPSGGLVFAVSTMFTPRENIKLYDPLVKHLGHVLGFPIRLKQRATYREVNNLFERGEVDFGFVCTGAFLEGEKRFGLRCLVVPRVEGKTTYQSIFLVPRDGKARTPEDLEGLVFGFTDTLSNTGCLYPTAFLAGKGTTPEEFFSEVKFLGSHQASIRAVAQGTVDAVAVDSLVYDHMVSKTPTLGEGLRVIHTSPPFGNPPVVARPGLPETEIRKLVKTLSEMDEDAEGRRILRSIGVEEFVLPPPGLYDSARKILKPVLPSLQKGE